jgi:hypothetical protein
MDTIKDGWFVFVIAPLRDAAAASASYAPLYNGAAAGS